MKKTFLLFITLLSTLSTFGIYKGTELKPDKKSYIYKIEMEQNGKIYPPCTATAISKNAMLTAGHCVDNLNLVENIYVHVNKKKLQIKSIHIPIKYYDKQMLYHKQKDWRKQMFYHRQIAMYDIAIILLKDAPSEKFNIVDLKFDKPKAEQAVTAFGIGFTKYNEKTKQFYSTPLNAIYRDSILVYLRVQKTPVTNIIMIKGSNFSDFLTTPGDSGGPLFIKGTHTQIGVLRGSSATEKESASIYTPLHLHKSFIKNLKL